MAWNPSMKKERSETEAKRKEYGLCESGKRAVERAEMKGREAGAAQNKTRC